MTTTLASLTTPLTVAECEAAIFAAIETRGASTTSWKSGAVIRTMIRGLAIVLAAFSTLQGQIANMGFLELSVGDWLTLVAHHVYGVERIAGTFASGSVTMVNAAGGVFSGAAGDLIFLDSTTEKTYRNTAAYSLGAMATISVAVEAVEIGTDSNAIAGEIDALVTTLSGVTVSNAAAVVGTDEETDAALRTRCSEKLGSLSPNGPADAYAYVARSAVQADGVTAIGVTRVLTVPDGIGGVDVYLATAAGGVTGTVGDLASDLGAVDDAIQTLAVPLAITARVQTATAQAVAVTYELWVRDSSGLTADLIEVEVAAALLAYITDQPIGGAVITTAPGYVYRSALETVIGAAVPGVVIKVSVTTPAADVSFTVPAVPTLGAIVVTGVHLIAAGA